MHIRNRSSTSSLFIAFQNFIYLSLICSDSVLIHAHRVTQRGLSADLHSLGMVMIMWGRLAIGCFGLQRCFVVMCFGKLVLATSVPDDIAFTPPFLDWFMFAARYKLVLGIQILVLECFAIAGFLSLTVRAFEKCYASALCISFAPISLRLIASVTVLSFMAKLGSSESHATFL